MPNEVTELTVKGTEYRSVDGYTFIFVADGIAFGETMSVDGGYYVSLGPYALDDLGEGEATTRTLYRAGSTLYVADNNEEGACLSMVDYAIDGELWRYEDTLLSRGTGATDRTEYIRFSAAQHSDSDMLLSREECAERVQSGDIRQLWPVWVAGHR